LGIVNVQIESEVKHMRFPVSKSILAAVILTSTTLITHAAKAETILKVPFSFTVAGQSMPAGLYAVSEDTYHNQVTLRAKDATKSFSAILVPGDPNPNEIHIALKFAESGSSHTLETIQYGPRVTPRLDKVNEHDSGYDPARLSQGR
jgi:hypothetical protein